ncbi:hypothetical protein Bbelb_234510 [Branchiostoma belcheri]|nr:hypothetical protein Bbelb_234510 [Branchiostoma belcheri]
MSKVRSVDRPPDGGWGWVVVIATFFLNMLAIGTLKSFGVFYREFREVFQGSAGITSFISSILGGVLFMCSVFAGALSNLTSCRTVIIAGGVISASGLVVSFFAQTMIHLFFSVGILTGFGFSLMYSPSLAMTGRYFDKRHATANGIGVCGTGIGIFAFPPLYQFLIDEFGWRGALLIVAGIPLNGCVCGALMRPIHLKEDRKEEKVDIEPQGSTDQEPKKMIFHFCEKVVEAFDVTLLKHRPFLVYCVSLFGTSLGNSIIFVHLVAHAQHVGVEKTPAAFLLSILGISEAVSRPLHGWLSDRVHISKLYYYMIGNTGLAILNIAIPFGRTYAGLVVCMVLYGFFSGSFNSLIAVMVKTYSSVSRISSGLGWALVFEGAGFLLGPPIAGWVLDATGNYDMSFHAVGIVIFLSAVVLFVIPCSTTRGSFSLGSDTSETNQNGIKIVAFRNLGWLYDTTGNYDMSFVLAAICVFVLLLKPCSITRRTLGAETGQLSEQCDGVVVALSHPHVRVGTNTVSKRMATSQFAGKPPDGGWGWMVVAGTFFIHVVQVGFALSFGVFYTEFREVFQESAGITSFTSSILGAVMLMCSPFAGALSNLTSCRTVIIAGGVISAVGLVVSFFAQTMIHLFLSVGILTGLGISLMYSPSLAMIGRYFDKRHATANGIAVCGTGVGIFALPPLFQFLIDEFGWRGALLIVGGLLFNGCVCGALMRPTHLEEDDHSKEQVDNERSEDKKMTTLVSIGQKIMETFDVILLKHRPFLVYCVSLFGTSLGNSMIFVHLVAHAQNIGVEKTSAVFLLSIMGISEVVSRPLHGWLSDRVHISKVYYYMIGNTGLAITNIAIPFGRTYTGLVVCMVLYGFFSGPFNALIAVMVKMYSSVSRISSGLGWALVFEGPAYLLGPPIAGWLYDATGNYDMSFYAAGIFIFLSAVVLLLNPCSTTRGSSSLSSNTSETNQNGIKIVAFRNLGRETGRIDLSGQINLGF